MRVFFFCIVIIKTAPIFGAKGDDRYAEYSSVTQPNSPSVARITSRRDLRSSRVLLVLRNLVNKEQGQDFDALMEKLTLPLQVGKNRFADLNAAKLVFADLADHISRKDFDTVQELYGVITSVDSLDHKADLVLIQIAGIVIEIVTDTDRRIFLANTGRTLEVKLNGRCWVSFGKIDAFQIVSL